MLSTAQFARWVKFGYCYRQHISEFRLLSKRVRTGLLSSAHFRQWGCYRAHSFQTVEFWGCCYRRHNTRIFQHGLLFCAHFPAAGFFHPPCWNAAHISHFSFFRARGCYTRHFLKIPQNFLCRHFPAKKLFYRCYAPHIVAFYTFVLECCAQHRCNTAHIFVGIFDIAILLF